MRYNFRRNRSGNVFAAIVVILFILTLIVTSGALYLEKNKIVEQYYAEKDRLEKEKNSLKEKIFKEEKQREEKEKDLFNLKNQYAELEEKFKQLENDYKEAVNLKDFFNSKFVELINNSRLNWSRIDGLTDKLDEKMNRFTNVLQDQKQNSQKKQNESDSVELPTVIVKDPQQIKNTENNEKDSEKKKINAEIMSINPQHNFVVINKGVIDGVSIGDVFEITRNGEQIALMTISELRDFVSLGIIKDLRGGVRLQEGDAAKQKIS